MHAISKVLEWITKLAYLNILWIGFSLIGLFVIGLFPATAATFTVARKWVTGESDASIFRTFLRAYRESLVQANLLGYLMGLMAYILYLDFLFITVAPNQYVMLLTVPFLFISILFSLTAFYVYPVYVYYDMKVLKVIKSAFFIMILNPLPTIVMFLGTIGITYLLWTFQGLAIFFSMSVLSVALMMPAQRGFQKVRQKHDSYKGKQVIEE